MESIYKTKVRPFSGTNYKEIKKKAFGQYQQIKKKTKRRPYVRSAYFNKSKIFVGLFWSHLYDKNYWDQMRRMKFFGCGIDLICNSRAKPTSKENPNRPEEILHRFAGIAPNGEKFAVQIKEDRKTDQKFFISTFPVD
jgi:hypothetical protein